MITSTKEQKICDKYSQAINGLVQCFKCPLRKEQGNYAFRCKANSHYNKSDKEWEYD